MIYCIFYDDGRIFGFGYFVPGAALYQRRKMGQGGERQAIVCVEKKMRRY